MFTVRICRRRNVIDFAAQPKPSAIKINGMPRPSEYATPSTAARPTSPVLIDSARIEPIVGPIHGAQPMPIASPSSGAPKSPALPRKAGRIVRCAKPNAPKKTSPSAITIAPMTRVMMSLYSRKNRPTVPPSTKIVTNTTVNPPINSSTPAIRRPRPTPVAVASVAPTFEPAPAAAPAPPPPAGTATRLSPGAMPDKTPR